MTNLKNLLLENIQNILMTCCQVSDCCLLGYLLEVGAPIAQLGEHQTLDRKSK